MPEWDKAMPVTSWWGGIVTGHPWTLVVVDPNVASGDELTSALDVVDDWIHRRGLRRLSLSMVIVFVCALVVTLIAVGVSSTPLVIAAVLLTAVTAPVAVSSGRKLRVKSPPTWVAWRENIDADIWLVVRHLNSYRNTDDDTQAAVRSLLWAVAHTRPDTPEHDALIATLAMRLTSWQEHDPATLRTAAAQIWAILSQH